MFPGACCCRSPPVGSDAERAAVEGYLERGGGVRIAWRGWRPPRAEERASVVVAHGAFEHSGRYASLGAAIAARGIGLYAVDHRGHGRSSGARGDIESVAAAAGDLAALLALAPQPRFVLGYSMGGVIALHCVLDHRPPPAGLILVAPAIDATAVSGAQLLAARALARLLPRAGLVAIDPQRLTTDAEELRAYRSDPLVLRRVTIRTVAATLAATRSLTDRLGEVRLPLLILHGADDVLAGIGGSRLAARLSGSADTTLRVVAGGRHDLLHDVARAEVMATIGEWVAQRASAPVPVQ